MRLKARPKVSQARQGTRRKARKRGHPARAVNANTPHSRARSQPSDQDGGSYPEGRGATRRDRVAYTGANTQQQHHHSRFFGFRVRISTASLQLSSRSASSTAPTKPSGPSRLRAAQPSARTVVSASASALDEADTSLAERAARLLAYERSSSCVHGCPFGSVGHCRVSAPDECCVSHSRTWRSCWRRVGSTSSFQSGLFQKHVWWVSFGLHGPEQVVRAWRAVHYVVIRSESASFVLPDPNLPTTWLYTRIGTFNTRLWLVVPEVSGESARHTPRTNS